MAGPVIAVLVSLFYGGCVEAPPLQLERPLEEARLLEPAQQTRGETLMAARRGLVAALAEQGAFSAERQVSHVGHVCTLIIDGSPFPVVDLEELVHGAAVPRGVFAALVLDGSLKVVRRIEYVRERPLFCRGAELYLYGDVTIDDVSGEGNKLVFGKDGHVLSIEHVEANDLPAPPGQSGLVR